MWVLQIRAHTTEEMEREWTCAMFCNMSSEMRSVHCAGWQWSVGWARFIWWAGGGGVSMVIIVGRQGEGGQGWQGWRGGQCVQGQQGQQRWQDGQDGQDGQG